MVMTATMSYGSGHGEVSIDASNSPSRAWTLPGPGTVMEASAPSNKNPKREAALEGQPRCAQLELGALSCFPMIQRSNFGERLFNVYVRCVFVVQVLRHSTLSRTTDHLPQVASVGTIAQEISPRNPHELRFVALHS